MERPTFYAVIPAFVRYANISAQAKLMYGEVTALCEAKGFCWASNGYFGKLYDANERTIRRWITELVKAGFVTVDLAANQYGERRIYIVDARTIMPGQICPDKNARHNDTSKVNDTSIDTALAGFEEIWKAKWSRGTAPNPRQPALKAYAAALKRGSSPADILAGVKSRSGIEKEGTSYAPQLVTWLNQERWKDTTSTTMKPEDLEAARRKWAESDRSHKERMRQLGEERFNQLVGRSA